MLFSKRLRYASVLKFRCLTERKSFSASSTFSVSDVPALAQQKKLVSILNADSFGQPTHSTHPHLLNENELVPGVKKDEFRQRRERLMTGIHKYVKDNSQSYPQTKGNLVIIPSAMKKYMSDKIPYVFRQNSDFFYLTGCMEPDSVLMMIINEHEEVKSILFMRPKDKHAELWDGPRTGVDNALNMFGVDEADDIHHFRENLKRRVISDKPLVWYDSPTSDQQKVSDDVREVAGTISLLNSPSHFIQSMRLFKSLTEQQLMRRTCSIASEAINEVMRDSRPGITEHHIYAMIDYKCRMRNANYLAYPPVVASGSNATTIHYINNSQMTKTGDLVLMDAGCEYAGYTSDVTRTWPISGEFQEPQKVLYDVVLLLQKELIETMLNIGGETLDNLFDTMCIKLGKYLQEVGLVPKDITDDHAYAKAGYTFCPHHVSHYLGLDVHDTPLMPRTLPLLPGMVCTVEPGIYISLDRKDVPREFRGIGVRVEDDVLITADSKIEILTEMCAKERISLENLFKGKSVGIP